MSFFDDDEETQAPIEPRPPRPRRSQKDRSRTRIQRLVVFIAVVVAVVIILAIVISQCRQHAKESAYRAYFSDVQAMIDESNGIGKQLGAILADPPPEKLDEQLTALANKQTELAKRAQSTEPPDKLNDLHQTFILGMQVRQRGVERVREALLAVTPKSNAKSTARKIAALSGYFTGPDVYYSELYRTQAQKVMADDGVTGGVGVPTSEFFLKHDLFDALTIAAGLERASGATSTNGVHGVGIAAVTAKPSGITLKAGGDTKVPSSTDLMFAVTVHNQGSVTETDVPVVITFTPAGGAEQTYEGTVASIGQDEKMTIELGPVVPTGEAIAKASSLVVKAGPVKNEKVTSNNSATYGVILEFN